MKKTILIMMLAILPANILFSAEKKADESWKSKKFTLEELKKYDGKEGRPAYVAVDGIVYNLSGSEYWKTGTHMKRHQAGADLTEAIKKEAPQTIHHGGKILGKMPKVGILLSVASGGVSPEEAKTNPELKSPILGEAEKALEPALRDEKTKAMREFFQQTGLDGAKKRGEGSFDEPLFVYFGFGALCSLLVTLFIGFNISKFGFRVHRFMALLTLLLALLHLTLRLLKN